MQLIKLATSDLLQMAAPYNPRTISDHDLEALARSMHAFGVVEPVVVNRRTNRIVGGHQRVKAAGLSGIEELPVVHVDLDEAQEKQLNIALNRISGEFDMEKLAEIMKELDAAGADLDLTGLDQTEIDASELAVLDAPQGSAQRVGVTRQPDLDSGVHVERHDRGLIAR